MLTYKQIKRENHIIEMLTLNNELGNDEFFTLVNVSKGWYVLTNEDIRYTIDNLYCIRPLLIN